MPDQQTQVLEVMTQIQSAKQSIDQILSTVQQAIAQVDHLAATAADWQAKIAGGELDPSVAQALGAMLSVTALQTALADQQALRTALVEYRDKHQGA